MSIERSFEDWDNYLFIVQEHCLKGFSIYLLTRRYSMQTGVLKQSEIVYLNGIRVISEERDRVTNFVSANGNLLSAKESNVRELNASDLENLSQLSRVPFNDLEQRNPMSQFDQSLVKAQNQEGSDLTRFESDLDQRNKLMQRGALTNESLINQLKEGKLNVTAPLITDKISDLSGKYHHSFFDMNALSKMKSRFGEINMNEKISKFEEEPVVETRIYFPGQNLYIRSKKKIKNLIHMKVVKGQFESFSDLESYLSFPVKLNLACGGVPLVSVDCHEMDSQTESRTKADSEWARIQENKQKMCFIVLEKSYLKSEFEEGTYYLKFLCKIKKKTKRFLESLKIMIHLHGDTKDEILKMMGLGFGQIKKKSFLKKKFTNYSMVLSNDNQKPKSKDKEVVESKKQNKSDGNSGNSRKQYHSELHLDKIDNEISVLSKNDDIDPGFVLEYLQQIGKNNFHLKRENEMLRDKLNLFHSKM